MCQLVNKDVLQSFEIHYNLSFLTSIFLEQSKFREPKHMRYRLQPILSMGHVVKVALNFLTTL